MLSFSVSQTGAVKYIYVTFWEQQNDTNVWLPRYSNQKYLKMKIW